MWCTSLKIVTEPVVAEQNSEICYLDNYSNRYGVLRSTSARHIWDTFVPGVSVQKKNSFIK